MTTARAGRFGSAHPRTEDPRLLCGAGRFVADIDSPGAAWAVFVRSPYAHAQILSVDLASARAMQGVLDIVTAQDTQAAGLGVLDCRFPQQRRPGEPMIVPRRPLLAETIAPHLGAPVAMVVARTEHQALDAVEAVEIGFKELASVSDVRAALSADAPSIWSQAPDNISFEYELGNSAAVDKAFERAAHVTSLRYRISRISAAALEPRAAIAAFDAGTRGYTLYCQSQKPFMLRRELASILGVAENEVRVVVPDVGGGFGMKGANFPEYALLLFAAKRLGRPVRWTATRSEAFLSDDQARDNDTSAALALDGEGRFLALRVRTLANLGAWLSNFGPNSSTNNLGGLSGVYQIAAVHAAVTGVFTNTPPIGTYRGAGRPEATFAIERLIDLAALETGRDKIALRRRNLIADGSFPADTGFVFTYDSGAFQQGMKTAENLADVGGFAERRQESLGRGRLRGLGFVNAIEQAGGGFEETAELHIDRDGGLTLAVGTISNGQGHETSYAQILDEILGGLPGPLRLVQGDTAAVRHGVGTFGSRSMVAGGAASAMAAQRVVAKARLIAAHILGAPSDDIGFSDGMFRVAGTNRSLSLKDIAACAYEVRSLPVGLEPGLTERAVYVPATPTFPNSVHVCEVEIDPATGATEILRYSVVDDVGRVVNPLLVAGQLHGGIMQGLGQALFEEIRYAPANGQLVSGSFMDYAMPRADGMPMPAIGDNHTPSTVNPLGLKGAGEAGTVGGLAVVVNAVIDALSVLGIRHLDMPLTPARIWQAIEDAKTSRHGNDKGPGHETK
jgi:carbon-monoxide dehydrogenase large subunit